MVIFPPPTATRCVPLSGTVGAAVLVVVSVSFVVVPPPCPSIEAIAVCVNNKAGPEMDAIMRIIMVTDPP
jgi:hypothetical protein